MDAALIVDGVIEQVWRDVKGLPEGYTRLFPDGAAVCGMIWDGTSLSAPVIDPVPAPALTYKADLWRRATDDEAAVIWQALSQQPIRKQRLFADCDYLDHADADFAEFRDGLVSAFGQPRADELLAPSA